VQFERSEGLDKDCFNRCKYKVRVPRKERWENKTKTRTSLILLPSPNAQTTSCDYCLDSATWLSAHSGKVRSVAWRRSHQSRDSVSRIPSSFLSLEIVASPTRAASAYKGVVRPGRVESLTLSDIPSRTTLHETQFRYNILWIIVCLQSCLPFPNSHPFLLRFKPWFSSPALQMIKFVSALLGILVLFPSQ